MKAGLLAAMGLVVGGAVVHGGNSAANAPLQANGDPRQIIADTCAACHAADLTGARGPSLLTKAVLDRSDADIAAIIAKGVPGTEMPSFAALLNPTQIAAIVGDIRARAQPASAPASPLAAQQMNARALAALNPIGQRIHSEKQDFRIELVAGGLIAPWGLAFLPDGRLIVTERSPAKLRIIAADGTLLPPIEGLPAIHEGRDAGLMDVAIGPNYASEGWIYLTYAEADPHAPEPPPNPPGTRSEQLVLKPSMTVVVRGKLDANNRWTQQQDIFRLPYSTYRANASHYGSRLLFDGKGHLFFTLGDRGEGNNAQDLSSAMGKIHRVNLDGSIPRDNPFAGRPGVVQSIWSYGHRNPQGLDFDPATGLLWEAEHGPGGGDEINVIQPGHNYGWVDVSFGQQAGVTQTGKLGADAPVAWYYPTIAPSGIRFYRGDRYPKWKGSLFVSALAGQQLRRLTVRDREVVSEEVLFSKIGRVRATATGPDGLLYALMMEPTGAGTGRGISDSSPGWVVRLTPIKWEQPQPMAAPR